MASSSTVDVMDEATTTLIADVKHMKETKTPQQVELYSLWGDTSNCKTSALG